MEYKSYGIEAINEDMENSLIVKPKLINRLDTLDTKKISKLSLKGTKDDFIIPPADIIMESLFAKKKKQFLYKAVKDKLIDGRYIEVLFAEDDVQAFSLLDQQYDLLKSSYAVISKKFFNSLFTIADENGTKVNNVDKLRKMVNLDLVLYIPHMKMKGYPQIVSYCEFAWNYDNLHGKINNNFFHGLSAVMHMYYTKTDFFGYSLELRRKYRSDEFYN